MKRLFYYMTLLAAVLLTACADNEAVDNEDPLPEGMGRIRLTIRVLESVGGDLQSPTRAVNIQPWEDPDHDWEILHTFRILICKASNNEVVQIISGDDTQMNEVEVDSYTYKESDEIVSQPLEAGSYHIFATANYADGYSVGSTVDPNATVKFPNGYSKTSTDYFGNVRNIPMTGKLTTTPGGNVLRAVGVSNGVTTNVTETPLTLWRVMAKMQFEFFNETSQQVDILGIEVDPINLASSSGPGIYLFSKDNLTSVTNLAAPNLSETANNVNATWPLHETMQTQATLSSANLFSLAQLSWGNKLESTGYREAFDAAHTKLQKFTVSEKVTRQDESSAIVFAVKPNSGYTFTPKTLSFTATRGGTNGGHFDVVAIGNGISTTLARGVRPMRYNGTNDENPTYISTYDYTLNNSATAGVFYVKIYLYDLDPERDYAFSDVVITGDVKSIGAGTGESITLPTGALTDVGVVRYEPTTALELAAGDAYDPINNPSKKLFFYVNETDATFTTKENQLSLRFKIQRNGYTEELRYGVTTPYIDGLPGGDGFNVIRRNDWIHIPIHITDWQLRIEPLAFVPIAGYPATTVSSDGLTATFSTGGFIILQPFVKKYNDATWLDFSDPNVTFVSVSWTNSDGTNVSGNGKIVKTAFTYDSANHCLIGELNNDLTSGPHKTTLTINVKLGSSGSQLDYSFTCNVILQK